MWRNSLVLFRPSYSWVNIYFITVPSPTCRSLSNIGITNIVSKANILNMLQFALSLPSILSTPQKKSKTLSVYVLILLSTISSGLYDSTAMLK